MKTILLLFLINLMALASNAQNADACDDFFKQLPNISKKWIEDSLGTKGYRKMYQLSLATECCLNKYKYYSDFKKDFGLANHSYVNKNSSIYSYHTNCFYREGKWIGCEHFLKITCKRKKIKSITIHTYCS